MADVVLTVAKSLVEGTLTKAQLAIEEEEKLWKKAQRDLVFIAGEFQMMQSFLSVTTKENVQNNIVSTCVTQVRDLAYDVEDCIEFILHLDTKPYWWCRLIPSCMAPARPLDEAVDILEHLKARVQDLSERNKRYKLMSDNSGLKSALQMREQATSGASDMRQGDMDALTKLITKRGSDLQVISVWSSGDDHSAASIIRNAYKSTKTWGNFSFRAWVKLGKHFCLQQFVGSLMDQIDPKPSEEQQGEINCDRVSTGMKVEEDLIKEFRKHLDTKPYLVVLEDLSTTEEWDTIRKCLPDSGNGSRVVVLTQQFQTASFCVRSPCIQRFWCDYSHCVFSNEVPLIGRKSEIQQLLAYPSQAPTDDLHLMAVWGIAGAGKSALVRNLYHDKMLRTKYEKYIWVDVSHSFNSIIFCQSLLLHFHSRSLEANGTISSGKTEILDPVQECKDLLKHTQMCFVVIDNLQCTEHWDIIKEFLVSISSGSLVIVTTSEERIALHCADKKGMMLNVKRLEFGSAIDLFKNQVTKNENIPIEVIDSDIELRKLISNCGGLPKVIVTVADCLAQVFDWQERARILNDKLVTNLESWSEFACLRGLFNWMQSYLGTLPDDLKQHVAYLLIFPGDCSIRRRRLLMRWVAEGYSKDSDSFTANENGEMLFSKLVELSMIHPPPLTSTADIRMVSYEVSNIFREYMVTRPPEENIAAAIEIFALRGTCSPTSRRRGRHLVIEESWDKDKIVYKNIDFSRLRSLTVFGKWDSFFITENMKVLRVLDLEDASGIANKDLQNILKWLTRLKFLSLRGCSDISYLPCSLSNLRQLQILDVRHTNIVTIPSSITNLRKLEYIRAGTSAPCTVAFKLSGFHRYLHLVGVGVMSGIGKLTSLHTVGIVNVGLAGGKVILKELRNLTQLRKLGVSGVSKKNGREFCSAVLCQSRLESLSVWLDKDNQECLDSMSAQTAEETSEPPKKLLSLKLYGPVQKLPIWTSMLNNLRKLNLEMDILSDNEVKVLGNLPELSILRLRVNPPQDGKVSFRVVIANEEELCYRKMKVLEISSRSELHLVIGLQAMENLELLRAGCCSAGSQPQFEKLKHLSKLKEVCVIGYNDTLKKYLEDQFAEHINKPILIMEDINTPIQKSNGGNDLTKASTRRNELHCKFPFLPATPSR